MEDEHVAIKDFRLPSEAQCTIPRSFFAVYDGHSSHHASGYAARRLHQLVAMDNAVRDNEGIGIAEQDAKVEKALEQVFQQVDKEIIEEMASKYKDYRSGTTAVCALLIKNELFVAHCGDSRAILGITAQDGKYRAIQLTRDHKPSVPEERLRIKQQGGKIAYDDDRVYSNPILGEHRSRLNMSRSLGDASHKFPRRLVESTPDVLSVMLSHIHQFLVLGSDGLFDVMSAEDVVDAVSGVVGKRKLDDDGSPDGSVLGNEVAQMAAHVLVQEALRRRTMDNVTALVVLFLF